MVMRYKEETEGVFPWRAIKQSLLLVTAIFLSTILVVAFSTAMQKATYFISHSIHL